MFPDLYGGAVCLDFANTLDSRASDEPEEHLHSYADLALWAGHAGLVDADLARRLAGRKAAAQLRTAIELREAIFGVFAAIGRAEQVPAAALAVVQRRYAEAVVAARLEPGDGGFGWQFGGDVAERVWWPVAVSAIELLTGGPLDRVKTCASADGCIGLFLDTSKNRSRRWCTMGCGIEAKIHRQAVRRRQGRSS